VRRDDTETEAAASPKAVGAGKYALFIVAEILLGIAFCVAIYYFYFRKA